MTNKVLLGEYHLGKIRDAGLRSLGEYAPLQDDTVFKQCQIEFEVAGRNFDGELSAYFLSTVPEKQNVDLNMQLAEMQALSLEALQKMVENSPDEKVKLAAAQTILNKVNPVAEEQKKVKVEWTDDELRRTILYFLSDCLHNETNLHGA